LNSMGHLYIAVVILTVLALAAGVAYSRLRRVVQTRPQRTLFALIVAEFFFLVCLAGGVFFWYLRQPDTAVLIIIVVGSAVFALIPFLREIILFKMSTWTSTNLERLQRRRDNDSSGHSPSGS